jgi:tRNA G26 N,N-dimethylase Trm1
MWLGPIHDPEFAKRALRCIEGKEEDYGTFKRMHGMLTLASEVSITLIRLCMRIEESLGIT